MAPVASSPRKSSTRSTPQKTSPRKAVANSPAKSPMKKSTAMLFDELPDLPPTVLQALHEANLRSFTDLITTKDEIKDELINKFESSTPTPLMREIITAWIECLFDHAQDGDKLSLATWRHTLRTSKLLKAMPGSQSKSSTTTNTTTKLTRVQLIRQRQALKRSKPPKINYGVVKATELRAIKNSLTKIPLGKALKNSISLDSLQDAKAKLRHVQ